MDAHPDFQQSVAVVIGVDAYSDGVPTLRTAAADARRLAQTLADEHGYDVRLLLDEAATREAILDLLTTRLPAELTGDDRLLFYFAGHGVALDGDAGPTGYLLPHDARRGEPTSYLDMSVVHDALCGLDCRHLLAILDSCFSGAFRWSATRDLMVLPEVIHQERYDRFIADPAWQAISSASHDQTALDELLAPGDLGTRGEDAQGHSPFATALFDALAGAGDLVPPGGDGVITATELYVYLERAVQPATIDMGQRQTPRLWPLQKHDKGEYIFFVPGHELNLPPAPPLTTDSNPWRGLESYDEGHADLFFGRDGVIAELHEHVQERPLTVVLGASGTGKSSVIKAGLVPRLRQDEMWHVLPVVRPGADPRRTIEQAVANLAKTGTVEERVAAWCTAHPGARLVLVVDQLEELVTMPPEAEVREEVLTRLARLVEAHPEQLRVVVTLRSDFEPQFDRTALGARWLEARYVVPPMMQDELRAVIEQPASQRVMYFTPRALVDDLINEVVQTPGGLPLLSFALSEMYLHYLGRRSDDRALERIDYQAVGGVVGALRTRADAEYEALDPAGRESMRRVMLRMVSAEGGTVARRRVLRPELVYPSATETQRVAAIVARLTAARLLVEGRDGNGVAYVEPAHDALVRAWDRLLGWIHAEQERTADLRFQHRLTRATQEWAGADSDRMRKGVLWRDASQGGLLLHQVVREERMLHATLPLSRRLVHGLRELWRRIRPGSEAEEGVWMNQTELDFARASIRRRAQIRLGLGVLVALIVAGGVVAFIQAGVARQERDIALSRYYIGQATEALDRDPIHALVYAIEAATVTDSVSTTLHAALFAAVHAPRVLWHLDAHDGRIRDLAVDSAGARVLTVGDDGWAKVWDAATGDSLAAFGGPDQRIEHASLSPDGNRMVSVSDSVIGLWSLGLDTSPVTLGTGQQRGVPSVDWTRDSQQVLAVLPYEGVARLWDAATGTLLNTFGEAYRSPEIVDAVFADGGRRVVTLREGQVRVWVADSARFLFTLGEVGSIIGIAVSPDGQVLATYGYGGGDARLWDTMTGVLIETIPTIEGKTPEWVSFGPSGDRLLLSYLGQTRVWRWTEQPFDEVLPRSAPTQEGLDFSLRSSLAPTGDRVVTADIDGRARVWGVFVEGERILSARARITQAAFRPDGTVLTAADDGTVRLWEVSSGAEALRIGSGDPDDGQVFFSPDGRFITRGGAPPIRWAVETGERVPFDEDDPAGIATWEESDGTRSPDGSLALVLTEGRLRVKRVETGDEVAVFAHPDVVVTRAEFDPTGARVVVHSEDDAVRFIDPLTGRQSGPVLRDITTWYPVVFSPRGRYALASPNGGVARLVDLETNRISEIASSNPHMARFSPDGTTLATVNVEEWSAVVLWTLETRQSPRTLRTGSSNVYDFEFDREGGRLLTVSTDHVVRIWDPHRPKGPLLAYTEHAMPWNPGAMSGSQTRAQFSPDGTLVLSEGFNLTARVWDAATGRDIAVFDGESVTEAAFSPDGRRVVVRGIDEAVRVYDLAFDELLRIAKERLPATLTEADRRSILAR